MTWRDRVAIVLGVLVLVGGMWLTAGVLPPW